VVPSAVLPFKTFIQSSPACTVHCPAPAQGINITHCRGDRTATPAPAERDRPEYKTQPSISLVGRCGMGKALFPRGATRPFLSPAARRAEGAGTGALVQRRRAPIALKKSGSLLEVAAWRRRALDHRTWNPGSIYAGRSGPCRGRDGTSTLRHFGSSMAVEPVGRCYSGAGAPRLRAGAAISLGRGEVAWRSDAAATWSPRSSRPNLDGGQSYPWSLIYNTSRIGSTATKLPRHPSANNHTSPTFGPYTNGLRAICIPLGCSHHHKKSLLLVTLVGTFPPRPLSMGCPVLTPVDGPAPPPIV